MKWRSADDRRQLVSSRIDTPETPRLYFPSKYARQKYLKMICCQVHCIRYLKYIADIYKEFVCLY